MVAEIAVLRSEGMRVVITVLILTSHKVARPHDTSERGHWINVPRDEALFLRCQLKPDAPFSSA